MKSIDLTNVNEASDSSRLPAGGYVCKILSVEDVEEKSYLFMTFDIVEGEYKGYFTALHDRAGFWGLKVRRSYKPTALPFFKRMLSAINKSNGNFVFDAAAINNDERTLVGKLIGLILQEEEYIGNDGKTKTRLNVYKECPIAEIRTGNFRTPGIKKLKEELPDAQKPNLNEFMTLSDDDDDELPFN